ncbi:hypothetical protein VIGAN_01221900, partial [Vigna angularis var. angularis]
FFNLKNLNLKIRNLIKIRIKREKSQSERIMNPKLEIPIFFLSSSSVCLRHPHVRERYSFPSLLPRCCSAIIWQLPFSHVGTTRDSFGVVRGGGACERHSGRGATLGVSMVVRAVGLERQVCGDRRNFAVVGRWISGFWFLFLVLVFCRAGLAVWFDFFDLVRRRRRTELLVYSFSGGLWSSSFFLFPRSGSTTARSVKPRLCFAV